MRMPLTVNKINPNGLVLYKGPSKLDRAPIIVVATGLETGSDNRKIGDFIQTWIMREDVSPTNAIEGGEDKSVCGDCVHRKVDGWGTCYVNAGQAPLTVWRAYHRGSYATFDAARDLARFAGRLLRLGSYGDPSAVPIKVWRRLIAVSAGRTGYTHQWHKPVAKVLLPYVMASCDSSEQVTKAKAAGWKTFRVMGKEEALMKGEFLCPASEEAGRRLTCEECLACHGGEYKGQATPAIQAHGPLFKVQRFEKRRL